MTWSHFFFWRGGGGTGNSTQGFMLTKQVLLSLYCLRHTSSPFYSGYFGDGGILNYDPPNLALILLIAISQVSRIIDVSYHYWLFKFHFSSIYSKMHTS
jgi:hypothetical protein